MSNIVLNSDDIDNKIKRLSYQIIEKNINEKELILIGIKSNGNYLSKRIKTFINEFSDIKVSLYEIEMDKKKLLYKSCFPELKHENINKKVVIFIDDVMNSASTIMYALNKTLHFFPKSVQIGVLIERTHKSFPLSANFKGLELSTSKYENVEVILNNSSKVIIT